MLGGKIIERQQYVAIFLEAGNGFVVCDSVKLDRAIERRLGILARLGHPDVLQGCLGLRLNALRQLVEHVRSLVHPRALLPHLAPDLAEGFPEAKGLRQTLSSLRRTQKIPLALAPSLQLPSTLLRIEWKNSYLPPSRKQPVETRNLVQWLSNHFLTWVWIGLIIPRGRFHMMAR